METAITTTNAGLVTVSQMPLNQNAAAVYLASLAVGSRRTMREALDTIAAMLTNGQADALTFDWSQIRFAHTAAIRSRLSERYSAASANKMLSALRGCLKSCWRLGQIGAEDYYRAADVGNVQGTTLPRGRALTTKELAALFGACQQDKSAAGRRDAAMLAVLYSCGLRRAELCALELVDYDSVNELLRVQGKRNKTREVPISNGARQALADWLAVRGTAPGAVFTPIDKGGRILIRTMHSEAIFFMLAKRAEQAGVKDLSPHDLRRTFCSDLLDKCGDIGIVAKLMGHSNIQTTSRYDKRDMKTRRAAVAMLNIPYAGRSLTS